MNKKETSLLVFPLKIKRETWKAWKDIVPREISMNTALIELIEQAIEQKTKEMEVHDRIYKTSKKGIRTND